MTLAILLSGQGGQHPAMFDLTADHPAAQDTFAAARPLLGGADPRDLARAGGDNLHANRTGQILCCVAAGHLVNGTSITRGEVVTDLTYWHVELESHDLLIAEGTPAESFLPAPGIRRLFDGPGADDPSIVPQPYAQRTELGPQLAALRKRLIRRAGASFAHAPPGAVRAWLDRCALRADGALRVAGWAHDPAQPDAPVCLDIVVDGAIVAVTVAAEYRADIAAAGVGDGRHGFDLGVEAPLAPGVPHVVEVRRSADEAVICAMAADAAGVWRPLLAA
ncbi:Hint domain-containing protein [Methylobacterium organophilum]|nr:Hint domain-containing protein [Methylobacterium organophilum]